MHAVLPFVGGFALISIVMALLVSPEVGSFCLLVFVYIICSSLCCVEPCFLCVLLLFVLSIISFFLFKLFTARESRI